MSSTLNIAIFASGNGTNMQAVTDYFRARPAGGITVALVMSDNAGAFVLERAKKAGIPAVVLSKEERRNPEVLLPILARHEVRYIVLAGYMKRIPGYLIEAFPGRILNIHPALLPKYGGKGMYGAFVHEAVKASGERETGITIHEVDGEFDHGRIVFQAATAIDPERESAEEIADKVHFLEHRHYPEVIEAWIAEKEAAEGER